MRFFVIFAGMMLLVGAETLAQTEDQKCVLPDRINRHRPNPDGKPTQVSLGIRLIDISKIDDVNQTAELDLYVRMRWQDLRLAPFAGCQFPLDAVWNPEIILLNSGRLFTAESDTVKVDKDGTVTYLQRYRGALKVPKRLDDFPFDRATFRISLIPRDLDEKDIQLTVDEKFTGRRPLMRVPD